MFLHDILISGFFFFFLSFSYYGIYSCAISHVTFFQCFLQDEQLQAVVGASGGGKIIAATAEVLLNHFAWGLDPLVCYGTKILSPGRYPTLSLSIPYDSHLRYISSMLLIGLVSDNACI